jgi:hypothetical protein
MAFLILKIICYLIVAFFVIYGFAIIIAWLLPDKKRFTQPNPKKEKPMRSFVPIEPTISAAEIVSLSSVTVTTALFDDGTTAIVPNEAKDSDYAIAQPDGSFKLVDKATFEVQYRAA